jgi:hypothetical protein
VDEPPGPGSVLYGRTRELRALATLVATARERGAAVVLHGDAGIGKTALLDEVRKLAVAAGSTTLTAVGVQAETQLPYAGLHQLVRPVLAGVADLPGPQRGALLAAFGIADGGRPEPFLIALAALNLLVDVAAGRPVVVIADDVQVSIRQPFGCMSSLGGLLRCAERTSYDSGKCSMWKGTR